MDEQESNATESKPGIVIVLGMLLLAVPCLLIIAVLIGMSLVSSFSRHSQPTGHVRQQSKELSATPLVKYKP